MWRPDYIRSISWSRFRYRTHQGEIHFDFRNDVSIAPLYSDPRFDAFLSMSALPAALRHHLHQIQRTQFKSEIPAHAKHNDSTVEMPSLKKIQCCHAHHDRRRQQPPSEFAPEPVCGYFDVERKLRPRCSGPKANIKSSMTMTPTSKMVSATGYPRWSRNRNSIETAGDAIRTPSW